MHTAGCDMTYPSCSGGCYIHKVQEPGVFIFSFSFFAYFQISFNFHIVWFSSRWQPWIETHPECHLLVWKKRSCFNCRDSEIAQLLPCFYMKGLYPKHNVMWDHLCFLEMDLLPNVFLLHDTQSVAFAKGSWLAVNTIQKASKASVEKNQH